MKTILDRMAEHTLERMRLLQQLHLWACVAEQGIDLDTVESFGFSEKLVTWAQQAAYRNAVRRGQPDPVTGQREPYTNNPYRGTERLPSGRYRCRVYNYVRLKDGTTTTLDPMLKAV